MKFSNLFERLRWIGVTVLLAMFQTVSAQQELTLKQAINFALQNKADAQKAKLEISRGDLQIKEAKAGALPQISASGAVQYNAIIQESALQMNDQLMVIKMGQPWNTNASVSVYQALFDQRVFTGLKAAKSTREFYQINAQLTNEQIIERVATAYYQVFVTEQKLKNIDASFENTNKVKNVIQSLYDNGLAKEIDLDRTKVGLVNIQSTRQQIVNSVELQENALKFYMGMPIETEIKLVEEDVKINEFLLEDKFDYTKRTEVAALLKQKELLGYNLEATKALLYPTVGLALNYGVNGFGENLPFHNSTYWSNVGNVALQLKVPIFTGGATKSKIQQAQLDIDALDIDIQDALLGLDLEYNNSKTQIENLIINLDNQKANVELAQKVFNNTQSNYQNGLATLTEVLDAEQAYTESKNNYSNVLLEYKVAEVALLKARGEINTILQ
ncbi:TolC family protein [Faecalibacter rhinopitheci]|uniref:TolC family protein n=1 Tax=Faecalibacter rhinopitheci TaxID=2779678 RepID=A0A8J7G7I3_9FLAO|nr:TolC family protein [Faecalibacter rhinopitheci]MBF0598262.1 TolC family protein [Faecalibacter rhinopitheci]